jgi:hypothetical protein
MKSERCRNGKNGITIETVRNVIKIQGRKGGGGFLQPQQNYVGTRMKI